MKRRGRRHRLIRIMLILVNVDPDHVDRDHGDPDHVDPNHGDPDHVDPNHVDQEKSC